MQVWDSTEIQKASTIILETPSLILLATGSLVKYAMPASEPDEF